MPVLWYVRSASWNSRGRSITDIILFAKFTVIVTICDYLDIWCLTIKHPYVEEKDHANGINGLKHANSSNATTKKFNKAVN